MMALANMMRGSARFRRRVGDEEAALGQRRIEQACIEEAAERRRHGNAQMRHPPVGAEDEE